MSNSYIYLIVLFCAFLGAIGQIFFKISSKTFSLDPTLFKNWPFLLGLALYAIATLLFVWSLKHGNLSILYPLIATSYIWVGMFSLIFLRETFPPFKWIGILLIILGIIIITKQ